MLAGSADVKEQLPVAAMVKLLIDVPEGMFMLDPDPPAILRETNLIPRLLHSVILLSVCQTILRSGSSLVTYTSGERRTRQLVIRTFCEFWASGKRRSVDQLVHVETDFTA
jgi:hypothetical protein